MADVADAGRLAVFVYLVTTCVSINGDTVEGLRFDARF